MPGLRAFLKESGFVGELRTLPLIESLSPERLAAFVERARHNDPSYDPPDFSLWKQIVSPPGVSPEGMARVLRESNQVETAYVMQATRPPDHMPDDLSIQQGYLSAIDGIDARSAWKYPGGDGAGIGFVDLEQGWKLDHVDLPAGITSISGDNLAFRSHGTSVLGIVLMADNGIGGIGIAHACVGRVVSQHRYSGSFNTADAILDAADNMAYGDVLLLEAQDFDPVLGTENWPVEIAEAVYEAIRGTTAAGIIVIEAAGNGAHDLDSYTNQNGAHIFDRAHRDSGAIMVGAATSSSPHTRNALSNYGRRIDCFAWGADITTTTTNLAGTTSDYSPPHFDGTSGASAIVAGAALSVQGLAANALGYRLSPSAILEYLVTGGTPSADPDIDRIGVMPNLSAILSGNGLNVAPDLYLRDHIGDDGDPTNGPVCTSPDIIVRRTAVADPRASFGTGSGTENDSMLSDDVDPAFDHQLYVRVLNRGGTEAADVSVDIYWAPPATLVTPNLWNLIGTADLASVPAGGVIEVSRAVSWSSASIPSAGHYCFVAVAGNDYDPKATPAAFPDFDAFVAFIHNNNSVAWRNFNVLVGLPSATEPSEHPEEPTPDGFYALPFWVPGAFDTARRFQLEAIGSLPAGSRAFLEAPARFANLLRARPSEIEYDKHNKTARIPLHPSGTQRLGEAMLHARNVAPCRLLVSIPEHSRRYVYDFAIRQMYKGREAGRITWRFAALPRK